MPGRHPKPTRYILLVSVAGTALLIAVLAGASRLILPHAAVYAALLVPGVLLCELMPLKLPRRPEGEEITLSTTFVLALLVSAGLPAALLAQVVASLVHDVVSRKPAVRAAFNVGQYTISLAAAAAVLHGLGAGDGDPLPFAAADLPAIGAASLTFFAVNTLIVGVVVALHQGAGVLSSLRSDMDFNAATNAVLLCLSPVILAAIHQTPWLYPLCLLPMAAVFHGGRQAARAEYEAGHDLLTGLPNRVRLHALVTLEIARAAGSATGFWLLTVDLDHFKEINDTLGHDHGDVVLCEVAERLRVAGAGTPVARPGGDEFVLLLGAGSSEQDAESAFERVAAALAAPFEVAGLELELGARGGIAGYPAHGEDAETLVRRAGVAVEHAKRQQEACVVYRDEHDTHSAVRLAMAGELRRGLGSGELVAFYQPQVDLASGAFCGAEALARWQHPTLGLLAPAAFVEIAERTGLVKALTLEMIEQSLAHRRTWLEAGVELEVAVNVSMRSLLDRRLPLEVERLLVAAGTRPEHLKLEITESTIMADRETATSILRELAALGVRLAIDDFGTGYSSLAYLRELPVDELKIDKSFVLDLGGDRGGATIVRSTVQLGHNLGLSVVAEGIETAHALEQLVALRCDRGQGYLLGRPMPADAIVAAVTASAMASSLRPAPVSGPRPEPGPRLDPGSRLEPA